MAAHEPRPSSSRPRGSAPDLPASDTAQRRMLAALLLLHLGSPIVQVNLPLFFQDKLPPDDRAKFISYLDTASAKFRRRT